MKYTPRDYQREAIDFILRHPSAALFLDMSLGKTVITLTAVSLLLKRGQVRKVLVLAPKKVAEFTRPEELTKWDHLQDLKVSVVKGTEEERLQALRRPADVFLLGCHQLDWLVNDCPAHHKLPFTYDMVVIDELTAFKNPYSRRFHAMMQVRRRVRRVVVPFNAVIQPQEDIPNYTAYLLENAGPAVMSWIVEGARKVIAVDCKPKTPQVVQDACAAYRGESNWVAQFLEDTCEVKKGLQESAGTLYEAYQRWCLHSGERVKSKNRFNTAIIGAGFERHHTEKGNVVYGLRVNTGTGESNFLG